MRSRLTRRDENQTTDKPRENPLPDGIPAHGQNIILTSGLLICKSPVRTLAGTNAAAFQSMDNGEDKPLRILAIDNEPSVIFSLRFIFTEPRYKLTGVENGDAALARLDAGFERFDIIIVDQKMPHLSGVELVGEIRKRGVTSKIMVLSADISEEIRSAYERMDVHVMFPKPFDVRKLRLAIDQLAA